MILSPDQQRRFWREWKIACDAQGWSRKAGWADTQITNERYSLLRRAGFESLTEVDRTDGFSAVLKELAALRDDLKAMLHADENKKRTLLHEIYRVDKTFVRGYDRSGLSAYTKSIMHDRFKHYDLDRLTEEELRQLLITLTARSSKKSPPASASPIESGNPF